MESAISDLVARFEKGGLTRRELVRGLAMLAGAGVAATAAQGADFKGSTIDHVRLAHLRSGCHDDLFERARCDSSK